MIVIFLTAFRAWTVVCFTLPKVAQHLAVLSKDTCLFEQTGQMPGADRSTDSVNSYLSVHETCANKYKMYASKYGQFVLSYAEEWYKVVTTRVGSGLKKAEELRVELDHYQTKVESLRQSANQTMAKGKQVDAKTAEKLKRNEDKLLKIKESTSRFTAELCILAEEVTERAWRDLHPLLVKIAQFDVTLSGDEAKAMSSLNTVVSELKKLAVTHGIKPQARLKDLETLDPQLLSTAQGESGTLKIEAGMGGLSLSSSLGGSMGGNGEMHFPPGSTSPQGLGGFPVQVQSGDLSNGYDMGRQSSFGGSARSGHSSAVGAPSTTDMMNIHAHAAPPPTMDSLSQAFGPTASSRGRNQSIDSFDSFRSGASAPPPAAPPPPPPGQTPSSGGYNPFGAPAPPPNPFGAAPVAPSPYGAPPPPAYGAPPPPPMGSYGSQPGSAPSSYGRPSDPYAQGSNFAQQQYMQPPPPAPASYGAPQLPPQYPTQSQQPQQQKYLGYNPF